MKAECPACGIDCKNAANLAAHLKARHPEYLAPEPSKKKVGGPKRKYASDEEAYEARKAQSAAISARKTLAGREIGPLPEVADPARRGRCERSLLAYCRTYHPAKFFLPFSGPHLKAVAKAERAVLHGGVFALAMARGSGKSEICKRAVEWAILYGHRRFVVLVGATGPAADALMADVQAQLETNDLLLADFPAACYPVRRLDRLPFKARGQLLGGEPTRLVWTSDRVTLAHVPGAACAGATVLTAGITASFRGLSATGPDGGTIRPDLVVVDDPQTRESATSLTQCATREAIIKGDVLGLAGPTKAVACLLPCTVIAPGDVADRLLDRTLSPQWQGERTKLVESFPTDEPLWEEYFRVRDEELRADGDGSRARAFYRKHRAELDAGCVLSWPERFDASGYASGVEEAMCYRRDRPEAFAAEMQNEPLLSAEIAAGSLSLDGLAAKSNKLDRGIAPRDATHLTLGIDVGKDVLYWCVTAWTEAGGGAVVDYGTYPKQNRPHFKARDARPTLAALYPTMDEEARVYAGLDALTKQLLGREYPRETTGFTRVEKGLIDSGWAAETIKRFVRQSPHGRDLFPSKGHGKGATSTPLMEWTRKPGQRWGRHWMINLDRLLNFDSNHWKSQVADRLLTPPAGHGALYLPGGNVAHFAEHLCSEFRTLTPAEKVGRKVYEWAVKPGGPDNHWWDALVLSAVAAALLGVRYDAATAAAAAPATSAPPQTRPQPATRVWQDPRELQRQARQMSRGR